MTRGLRKSLYGAGLLAAVLVLAIQPAQGASTSIVVSQVYGGGGNSGATYKNDFVELFNPQSTTMSVTGWSVQQTSATGSTWNVTNLTGTIPPGGYYLVQQAAGAGGTTDLPTPDATGNAALGATSGKIALVSNQTALTCGGAPNNCIGNPAIVDFVGYGTTANNYEGAGPTAAPSNTTAALRLNGGCQDTDNNAADFAIVAPTPRNSASPGNPCTVVVDDPPTVSSTSPSNGATGVATNTNVSITFSEPVTATTESFTISCGTSGAHTFTLAGGPTTYTLDPTTDLGFSETCTVTVVATQVVDQDGTPTSMAADYSFSFTTAGPADDAPSVTSTTPANGATGVALDSNVSVTFSESVAVSGSSFTIACDASGAHGYALTGGPTTYTLNPSDNFRDSETCTVTVVGSQVSDTDANDPPDTMAADYSFSFSTMTPLPIGVVQGSITDTTDGPTHRSSYAPTPPNPATPCASNTNGAGQTVLIQGVIYQKTLARSSSGSLQHGFFIQNTALTKDADPNSSDGIFVFMGSFTSLIGGHTPVVGEEIVLQGRVTEFFCFTQLSSASMVRIVRTGVPELETLPFIADPPDNLADANRYWERREGMNGQVPAGSHVIADRDVFPSTFDGEVWVMHPDHPLNLRTDPFTRRSFRDPHPFDNNPDTWDDGNGYRIMMGSIGIKASGTPDSTRLIAPARVYDTITNAPAGGLYFTFSKYALMVEEQIEHLAGADPSTNAPPREPRRPSEYSVATFNVENLYDYRDDPNDGCDFTGNSGCPGVSPPFDYVPASEAVYQAHLNELAQQVANDLKAPEILMAQEAEDQDICTVVDGELSCGTADNRDGRPDTLQELALEIAAVGGPEYQAAYDRNGADDRGIVSAFLYRVDRVQLLPVSTDHPVFGNSPTVSYRSAGLLYNRDTQNPKSLNAVLPADVDRSTGVDGSNVYTRAPQVGLFRIWLPFLGVGRSFDLYAISNHFSSTPDGRVGQRQEQAGYNAAIVAALPGALAEKRVITGGDFNVFPRPDDPFPAGHPRHPSDQLKALYDAGLSNTYDVLLSEVPESAYSYVFQGQAQVLDSMFMSPTQRTELAQVRVAHVNSDWPADYPEDGPRGASDHDPSVAIFGFPTGPPQPLPQPQPQPQPVPQPQPQPVPQPQPQPQPQPRGPRAALCRVPNVRGKSLAQARAAITRAGCRVGSVSRRKSAAAAKGRVVSQSPRAGVRAVRGTRVHLVLSAGGIAVRPPFTG